jgi:glycolate oxidase FAD binding subunit
MSSPTATSRINEFRSSIASSINAGLVRDADVDQFDVDGVAPDVVVAPSSEQELATVLREANEYGLAVIPFGAGRHMTLGNAPKEYDVALSMAQLNRVVAHEPADLTVTVEPGARLSDLEALLAQHNQFLPLDPPGGDAATVGGLIASAVQGPLRHAFGSARDWLIGVRVVHADGRMSKAGGRVVKNVTGYEMTKLYTGSFGTLGVISEATFKLMPAPAMTRTVAAYFHSPHAAATFAFAAQDAGLSLYSAELLSPPAAFAVIGQARWAVLMRAAGTMNGVDRTLREIAAIGAGVQASIEEAGDAAWRRWSDVFALGELALRLSVAPSAIADAMEVLDRRFAGAAATLSSTISAGVLRANLRPSQDHRASALVAHARAVASRHEGFVVVEAAPPSFKRQEDVFGPLRPDFAIMKRLKDEFDPRRTLSPGRFVGRL